MWAAGIDQAGRLPGKPGDQRSSLLQTLQRPQEGGHDFGVELRAGAAPQLGEALAVAQGAPIGPLARHGVVAVDHAHGARHQGDLDAAQAVGVPAAVEALVVVTHAGDELFVEQRAHDLGADAGVLANELPFFRGEWSGLEQYTVGDADLADVVAERDVLQLVQAIVGPAELAGQHHRVGGHPAGVAQGVVVLGAERRAQGPQVGQVQALDLFVELSAFESQGHEMGAGFGDGDLLVCELTLAVVEEVDQADDLVSRDQGQRD